VKHQEQLTENAKIDLVDRWLSGFKDLNGEYVYFDLISNMINGQIRLHVNFPDLSDELALLVRNEPGEMVEAFNKTIQHIMDQIHSDYGKEMKDKFKVSFVGLDPEPANRLTNDLVEKMICIACKVLHIGDVRQVFMKVAFTCMSCRSKLEGTTNKLKKCTQCGERDLELDFENCTLEDLRFLEVVLLRWNDEQHRYVERDNAETVILAIRSDLVDVEVDFDEELLVTGTVHISASQGTPLIKEVATSFLYLEVNALSHVAARESATLDVEDVNRLRAWNQNQGDEVMNVLVASYSPRVYGYPEVKEILLYQAVGAEVQGAGERDWINVLAIGDTGVSKTELSQYQAALTDGIYQSGEGLSGPGITIALDRDERTGGYLRKAGLAVRGNGKLKALDEIDKMIDDGRKQMATVMESGFYNLGKVKHGTYATKGPWFCTGNPRYGNYDPYRNITENLAFPSWMLSRFDIVLILRDTHNKEITEAILNKIDSRSGKEDKPESNILGFTDLQKHIRLAKQNREMCFESDAVIHLHGYYQILRSTEEIAGMIITPRQYLGLRRMAIARAKLHLRANVTKEDVDRAIYLMNYTLAQVGIDVTTGHPDLGVLYGKPQSKMTELKKFMDTFTELAGSDHRQVTKEVIIAALVEKCGFKAEIVLQCITQVIREGWICERSPGVYVKS
jgi:replicative DNA helicase Mcm